MTDSKKTRRSGRIRRERVRNAQERRQAIALDDVTASCVASGSVLSQERPTDPPIGSWAETARVMAAMFPDEDFDWDAWKEEMKETHGQSGSE